MTNDPYTRVRSRGGVPVTQRLSPNQVQDSDGAYVYALDDWARMDRFLILGSEGGTYYIGEGDLTKENAAAVDRCIKADFKRAIDRIVEISVEGRNPKQNPLLFAYAMACGADDQLARVYALAFLNQVCRTGTMLFVWARYVEQFRGWGRSLRNAVARWYTEKDPHDLALQLVKYQQREGWSHRDLLRLAKPGAPGRPAVERGSALDRNLAWAVGKPFPEGAHDTLLQAHDEMHEAGIKPQRVAELIELFRVPWEAVPSEHLANPEVWNALLPYLGMGALVRNLGRLTANGTIKPMKGQEVVVTSRLTNRESIERSRIHPFSVLLAASTYAAGRGVKGSLTWQPNGKVLRALDTTFGMAFKNIEPAGKRTLVALDVSGSMDSSRILNTHLSAREASSAMALVTLASEPQTAVMAFSSGFIPLALHAGMSLADVVQMTRRLPFDATDCSAPIAWAIKHGVDVDTFVIYTDSETNRGVHVSQALREYRQRSGIPAKMVVVGMTSNGFSIADPNDGGMLDVVGFDSAAPSLIADFSAGRV
jgi:60 kDa SS-A/Ro ribonucleoprotein